MPLIGSYLWARCFPSRTFSQVSTDLLDLISSFADNNLVIFFSNSINLQMVLFLFYCHLIEIYNNWEKNGEFLVSNPDFFKDKDENPISRTQNVKIPQSWFDWFFRLSPLPSWSDCSLSSSSSPKPWKVEASLSEVSQKNSGSLSGLVSLWCPADMYDGRMVIVAETQHKQSARLQYASQQLNIRIRSLGDNSYNT